MSATLHTAVLGLAPAGTWAAEPTRQVVRFTNGLRSDGADFERGDRWAFFGVFHRGTAEATGTTIDPAQRIALRVKQGRVLVPSDPTF